MRYLMGVALLLGACGSAGKLPEPDSAPRFEGEVLSARSGGFAGEVATASSLR